MCMSALGRAMLRSAALEPLRTYPDSTARLEADDGDESLDEFLSARIGPELARILGSALVHGIYAADSRVLSTRAAFPLLWNMTTDGRGSIVRGMLSRAIRRTPKDAAEDYDLGSIPTIMQSASVYSFNEGMSTLVRAMEKALGRRQNVEVVTNERVTTLARDPINGDIEVSALSGDSRHV